MNEFLVLDSFALLAYYQQESGWAVVEEKLQQAKEGKVTIFVSEISIGEVYYMTCKKHGEERAKEVLANLWMLPLDFVLPQRENILNAATFKSFAPISYADCIVLELAISKKAVILTGDPEFKNFEKEVKIKWI